MKRITWIIALITLCGCAEIPLVFGPLHQVPTRIAGTGERVGPPEGFMGFCARHPEDPGCKELCALDGVECGK